MIRPTWNDTILEKNVFDVIFNVLSRSLGDTVVYTVTTQQEGSWFKSLLELAPAPPGAYLVNIPPTKMDEVVIMTYTAVNHQRNQDYLASLKESCHVIRLYTVWLRHTTNKCRCFGSVCSHLGNEVGRIVNLNICRHGMKLGIEHATE